MGLSTSTLNPLNSSTKQQVQDLQRSLPFQAPSDSAKSLADKV